MMYCVTQWPAACQKSKQAPTPLRRHRMAQETCIWCCSHRPSQIGSPHHGRLYLIRPAIRRSCLANAAKAAVDMSVPSANCKKATRARKQKRFGHGAKMQHDESAHAYCTCQKRENGFETTTLTFGVFNLFSGPIGSTLVACGVVCMSRQLG